MSVTKNKQGKEGRLIKMTKPIKQDLMLQKLR